MNPYFVLPLFGQHKRKFPSLLLLAGRLHKSQSHVVYVYETLEAANRDMKRFILLTFRLHSRMRNASLSSYVGIWKPICDGSVRKWAVPGCNGGIVSLMPGHCRAHSPCPCQGGHRETHCNNRDYSKRFDYSSNRVTLTAQSVYWIAPV